jgi:hypothetical protein
VDGVLAALTDSLAELELIGASLCASTPMRTITQSGNWWTGSAATSVTAS